MSIGERITELRNKQDISQVQLAKLLDVSRQAVSKWENDQSSPDTIRLIRLADILNVDLEYLATGRHRPVSAPKIVTIEKIVEKPVPVERIVEVEKIVTVEKTIEVEKPVEIIIEKPVVRKVSRIRYLRNPIEFLITGIACFVIGLLIGFLI